MSDLEFAEIMAFLGAAVGKPASAPTVAVYFELLGDLPAPVLRVAARRAILEHRYATLPPISLLRELAVLSMRGEVHEISPAQAWAIAIRAIERCDVDSEGSVERAFAKVPRIVQEAVAAFGFKALYNPDRNIEVMRAQFMRIFEQLADAQRKGKLLPSALKAELEAARPSALPMNAPKAVIDAIARIGKGPEA